MHPSQEGTYRAISGDYLQHTDHPGKLNREIFAILSNAVQQDIKEVEDSDTEQPPKLPEMRLQLLFSNLLNHLLKMQWLVAHLLSCLLQH